MNNVVPEGWRAYNLGELASKIEGGGTPSRTEPKFWNGALPWATVKDLKGIRLQSTLESISLNGLKQSASKLVPANTMILASRMAVGKAVVFDREVAINQDLKAFYPKPILESAYLLQWYLSKAEVIAHMGTGSTVKGIKLDDINSLPIDLPPLPEQKKIAAILTSVDDVIEKTQAQIDKLKDLKTGMMQELLTRGVGVDGKPHSEFKDSPVGRIPKGWEVVTLGDITEESVFGPRFSSSEYAIDGNIGCIRTTDMDENWDINYSTTPRAKLNHQEFEKHFLRDGDLLVTRSGTCGLVDVFKEQSLPMVAAAFLIRFRLITSVNPYFVRYLMMSSSIQENVQLLASGGVQKNLSGTSLKTLKLPMPSVEEQNQVVNAIESINRSIASVQRKQFANKVLKKALMQDLLTGKVRVKVEG